MAGFYHQTACSSTAHYLKHPCQAQKKLLDMTRIIARGCRPVVKWADGEAQQFTMLLAMGAEAHCKGPLSGEEAQVKD